MISICWFRRVLRLHDHPALVAAARRGPVIPLVILDPDEAARRPASAARQAASLPHLARDLAEQGSRLVIRRGSAAHVLPQLLRETGAVSIHATAGFPFASDDGLNARLAPAAIHFHSPGDLVSQLRRRPGGGGAYKVFTPFWKALRQSDVSEPLAAPVLTAPQNWPASDPVDWPEARTAMARGWDILNRHFRAGERQAHDCLDQFLNAAVAGYALYKEEPWRAGATSELSEALAVGEISARQIWRRALLASHEGVSGVEPFLRQLAWRAFSRELCASFPDMDTHSWRPAWEAFPWRKDNADAEAWRRGETGEPLVDAGMRELYATGRMHNRVRMITASYLTKHLLTDWRVGVDWFSQTLADWDPASNAVNWQWVAGCGPDASPFFRIFNPQTQAAKFDGEGRYRDYWLKETSEGAQRFASAAPRSWRARSSGRRTPDLDGGRRRALAAFAAMKTPGMAE
ncbi:cryptochrome/photolyase family protein [Camelimonas fluminis]|uniref:Cryptochrome/photolyase family protein n=1 Tax=Camelimonas fluminis TaxID=1576911 RepID=A0ABV7ULW1_9HYPH|nr:deoxyribodipyrimidine photo-lyase [Camelimonas fluminis]